MLNLNFMIHTAGDLAELIETCGFLPTFHNNIPGFSVEEHTPPELWFAENCDGPWEWKGPVIQQTNCVYGKLFLNKSAFVSKSMFANLLNYRRNGYDFDARYDDGLASFKDKMIWDSLMASGPVLSTDLKKGAGFTKEIKGYDTSLTRLQMQTYIITTNFEYRLDRNGKQYGWGIARYALPEQYYGEQFIQSAYKLSPLESYQIIYEELKGLLPWATENDLIKIIG